MKVRLETMSKKHCFFFLLVVGLVLFVIGMASIKTPQMLNLNFGDNYYCASLTGSNSTDC